MKRVLLVHARFPVTYWGFQDALRLVDKKASLPPLGLATLAACLPASWDLRLIDLNVRDCRDEDLLWADAVLLGGMLVQLDSLLEVIRRSRALGRPIVVGGPAATTTPELFEDADVVFQGEVEGRIEELAAALDAAGEGRHVVLPPAATRPSLGEAPVPRFDLLEMGLYSTMAIQYSRGCPFHCEFCDIVEMFGHVPRVKTAEQVLAEMEAIRGLGYQGSIFIVDDNFIGNKVAVRELLPRIVEWQLRWGRPFDFYTEASVNLATDPALMASMVEAGFRSVFVGIETPSKDSLRAAGKAQNLKVDLAEAVDRMTRAGLEVMGGFIVGFDNDGPEVFEAQRAFIQSSPVPLAMVGVLAALPGTRLWRRLEAEGRLRGRPAGDQFDRANFEPDMDELTLLRGYRDLMASLYSADAYYRRCEAYVDRVGVIPIGGVEGLEDVKYFLKALARVGVASPRRRHFWRLLAKTRRAPAHTLKWAVVKALQGEHMIRYTEEHVLPRLDRAIAAVAAERRGAAPARSEARRAAWTLPIPEPAPL